jgi:sigma-E factor negative regulatory protein RseA
MSQPDSDRSSSESSRRILSALADGDATDGEAARAFQAWRDDPDARAAWHSYQLIGDVLRSEDLACEPKTDEAFLVALRARLADEPVVLAPQPRAEEADVAAPAVANAGAAARHRARWQGPVAMAAGFLVVIGGLNIVRPFGHGSDASVASAGAASGPLMASAASSVSPIVATGLQTPAQTKAAADQLAPYLAAHRQSAMNAPFQMPGNDLRNVNLVQPAQ